MADRRKPKTKLTDIVVREVSLVDQGDNPPARFVLAKRRTDKEQPSAGAVHTPGVMDDDERRRRRRQERRREGLRQGRGRLRQRGGSRPFERRSRFVKVTVETTEDQGHVHTVQFPEGRIEPGVYRTSEDDGHEHEVILTEPIEPGQRISFRTQPGGEGPHTHGGTVMAIQEQTAQRGSIFRRLSTLLGGGERESALYEKVRAGELDGYARLVEKLDEAADLLHNGYFDDERGAAGRLVAIEEVLDAYLGEQVGKREFGALVDAVAQSLPDADEAPGVSAVRDVLEKAIATTVAGQSDPPPQRGEGMALDLSKLSKADREAVEEAFETAFGEVRKLQGEVTTLKGKGGDPEPEPDPEAALYKGLPAELRDLLVKRDAENAELRKQVDALTIKDRKATFAKSLGDDVSHLPVDRDQFVDMLWDLPTEKRDKIVEALKSANGQARIAGLLNTEVGVSLDNSSGPGGAYAKMQGIAKEMRKQDPKLSEAEAMAKVMNDKPELYAEYLDEQGQLRH